MNLKLGSPIQEFKHDFIFDFLPEQTNELIYLATGRLQDKQEALHITPDVLLFPHFQSSGENKQGN